MISSQQPAGAYTREQIKHSALILLSLLVLYACWKLLEPFLAPVAWALALAVVVAPMQNQLQARLRPTAAAILGTFIVVIVLLGPVVFLTQQIVAETGSALPQITEALRDPTLLQREGQPAWVHTTITWLQDRFDLDTELQKMTGRVAGWASSFLGVSAWALTQWVVMIVTLFYFLRDQAIIAYFFKSIVPLTTAESDALFARISQAIHATVYGNVLVKLIQGGMTGIMFWILGLPLPILFGAASAIAALLPSIGTALIWGPAVVWLFFKGMWIKGTALLIWGAIAVSLIDNFLYPMLVANELSVHPLAIFFSVFGGMLVFGLVGMVLGPVILAIAYALLEVWRLRYGPAPEEGL
jgi:predicted PurR-regulated permease PerM